MVAQSKPLKCWSATIFAPELTPPRFREISDEFAQSWVFQKERGATSGKEHFQCRWITHEPLYKESLLVVLEARGIERKYVSFRPESCNSIKQGGLAFYCMKDETRIEGPWHDDTYRPPKRRKTYAGEDLACMENPRPFQARIIELLDRDWDDRHIYWWCDAAGGAGKSKLLKWLRFKGYDMARVPMGTATQIKTAVIDLGVRNAYLVDLPRVQGKEESIRDLFSALEEIKNGWVVSAMYGKPGELLMKPPHLHIFSNELPNPHVSSLDRWLIFSLIHDREAGHQIWPVRVSDLIS